MYSQTEYTIIHLASIQCKNVSIIKTANRFGTRARTDHFLSYNEGLIQAEKKKNQRIPLYFKQVF
uniref:Uncharacterized protein n=1 Tax=Anguilla anguilla TaxID=7936 RepID=A0A0E9TGF7_ANGAN